MATDQPIDYNAVLADLKAQRAKLDAGIAGIEAMLGLRGVDADPSPSGGGSTNGAQDIGTGAFLGLSIVDATKKYLAAVREPKRNEDIYAALKRGGLIFTSSNPINTIGSVLNRDWTNGGDIVRVSRGVWGLAEWNPRLRRKPEAASSEDASDLV